MYAGGVTKGGVAYSYAVPGASKGGGVTKGGVAYSYGPGPAVSPRQPSQNYYSGYGAPGMYHYAHGHSAPSPLAQQYAPLTQPPLQQQQAFVSQQYAPPQYAPQYAPPPQYAPQQQYAPPPQYAPPHDAPLQYAPANSQTAYHRARGGRVFSGRVVSSERVEATNWGQTPPLSPGAQGGPSWLQRPLLQQGPPRQDAPLQYIPQQDAPPQVAPLQYTPQQDAPSPSPLQYAPQQDTPPQDASLHLTPLHEDTYDHAAVRAAAGRAAAGRPAAEHTSPRTTHARVTPPATPPPPSPVARIGNVSSRVVGVSLRQVTGREAAEMVSSHDRAQHGQVVAPGEYDLARFKQRMGPPRADMYMLDHRAPATWPPSPLPQYLDHALQYHMPQHYLHHALGERVLPTTLAGRGEALSLAEALAASSQVARLSPQPTRAAARRSRGPPACSALPPGARDR